VVWGTGEEVRDFLHVTDLVRGCLLLLERHAVCEPVNIGCGKPSTIREIVGTILRLTGHKGARVLFDASKPTTIPYRAVSTAKAERVLGFVAQTSLEEGLRDTVEWYGRTVAKMTEI
jgi:GDP-L-fucose synthase